MDSKSYEWSFSTAHDRIQFDDADVDSLLMCVLVLGAVPEDEGSSIHPDQVGGICLMTCAKFNRLSASARSRLASHGFGARRVYKDVLAAIASLFRAGYTVCDVFGWAFKEIRLDIEPHVALTFIVQFCWGVPVAAVMTDAELKDVISQVMMAIHTELSAATHISTGTGRLECHSFISYEYADVVLKHPYPPRVYGVFHSTIESILRQFTMISVNMMQSPPTIGDFIPGADKYISAIRAAGLIPSEC